MYIRHDNALECKVLIKVANALQWKLGLTVEYTKKSRPQQNQLTELRFIDVANKARAMMVQANLSAEIKYKFCGECFNCPTYLSNLSVVTLKQRTSKLQPWELGWVVDLITLAN